MGRTRSGAGAVSPTLRKRLAQVRACEESGETLKSYAEQHGLSVGLLYQAKKLARKRGLLPPRRRAVTTAAKPEAERSHRFVEAVRLPATREPGPAWRLRFAGGEVLESSTPLGIDDALRLAALLGGRS
jgi:transposase-like protein